MKIRRLVFRIYLIGFVISLFGLVELSRYMQLVGGWMAITLLWSIVQSLAGVFLAASVYEDGKTIISLKKEVSKVN